MWGAVYSLVPLAVAVTLGEHLIYRLLPLHWLWSSIGLRFDVTQLTQLMPLARQPAPVNVTDPSIGSAVMITVIIATVIAFGFSIISVLLFALLGYWVHGGPTATAYNPR
jgi:hypothetical protein